MKLLYFGKNFIVLLRRELSCQPRLEARNNIRHLATQLASSQPSTQFSNEPRNTARQSEVKTTVNSSQSLFYSFYGTASLTNKFYCRTYLDHILGFPQQTQKLEHTARGATLEFCKGLINIQRLYSGFQLGVHSNSRFFFPSRSTRLCDC